MYYPSRCFICFSFYFLSPLFPFSALSLNFLIFHDFSLWLCENTNPWNPFLFNPISLYLSSSPSSLYMAGVMPPFCLTCFTHYVLPWGPGFISLGNCIPYWTELKIPLIVTKKKMLPIQFWHAINYKTEPHFRDAKMLKTDAHCRIT